LQNRNEDLKDPLSIELENRVLKLRKAPACPVSGYICYLELYLDDRYEGYIGIPKKGSPNVMIYGRSPTPGISSADDPTGTAACDEELPAGK